MRKELKMWNTGFILRVWSNWGRDEHLYIQRF